MLAGWWFYQKRPVRKTPVKIAKTKDVLAPANTTATTTLTDGRKIDLDRTGNGPETIASPASYSFQFRDAATNAVLGSFTMSGIKNGSGTNTSTNSYRYRNFTIVY